MINSSQLNLVVQEVLEHVRKAADQGSPRALDAYLEEHDVDPTSIALAVAECCTSKGMKPYGGSIDEKGYRAGVFEGLVIGIAAARIEAKHGGQCNMCGAPIKVPTPDEQKEMHERVRQELTESGQVDDDTEVNFEDVFLCPACVKRINAANN